MDFKKLKGLIYDKENQLFGTIIGADFIEGIVLVDVDGEGKEMAEVGFENAVFLEEIGAINDTKLFNHDILIAVGEAEEGNEGKFWEVIKQDNDTLYMQLLLVEDGEVVKKDMGKPFEPSELELFNGLLEVLGNAYELDLTEYVVEEEVVDLDFNIAILRKRGIEYFYACNNKAKEEIDLIKVIFVGAKLLDGEYQRETVSYDEYIELIKDETFVEVSPQELQNYAVGAMYGKENEPVEDVCACGERVASKCYADDCDDVDEDRELDVESDFDLICPSCECDYLDCDCD